MKLTWLNVDDPLARDWAGVLIRFIAENQPEAANIQSLVKNG